MNDTQLTTVQETVFDLQRLHHLMSILITGYESETIALQKMKETSYPCLPPPQCLPADRRQGRRDPRL